MKQKNSDLRNNLSKCLFNNYGYCKYKEECKKKHSSGICQNPECDGKCPERHPKHCKLEVQ